MNELIALALFAADQVGDVARDLGPWANAGVLGVLVWLLVTRDKSYQDSVQKLVDSFKAERKLDRESWEKQTDEMAGIMSRTLELIGSCVKVMERTEQLLTEYRERGSGGDIPARRQRTNND